jgi:hypothetical protein
VSSHNHVDNSLHFLDNSFRKLQADLKSRGISLSNLIRTAKRLPFLVASLAVIVLAIACSPQAGAPPSQTDTASASLWSEKPDATGHYYAGNPDAKLVIEEWGDLQ